MLARLLSWLTGRDDQRLFRYWDGGKWRRIDPIKAHRGLWRDEQCDLMADAPVSADRKNDDGSNFYTREDVIAAEDRIRDLTCRVFDVKNWSELHPGLTALELDDLLNDFIEYCDELKKKLKPSRTSSAPSTAPVPLPSSDAPVTPPSNEPASSSMPTESTVGAPTGP